MSTFSTLKASVLTGILAGLELTDKGPQLPCPSLDAWWDSDNDAVLGQCVTKVTIDGPGDTVTWEIWDTPDDVYVVVERWTNDEPNAWTVNYACAV